MQGVRGVQGVRRVLGVLGAKGATMELKVEFSAIRERDEETRNQMRMKR